MYDGKQVFRIVNNYKSKDLYNIGNEMTNRKGTGNYDKERTRFNTHFKDISAHNLYQEVKNKLNDNNIEYLNKSKTNMLNGVTITSGPEFFRTLGMTFKPSGRKYQSGNKKGQDILVPDIKSEDDIPIDVKNYFACCYEFLKNKFGEDNIVMAQVHYDEDTPHLQAYFLPIVSEIKRKSYKRDSDGNLIKEEIVDKNGNTKIVPILNRDANGNIIYELHKGKFLNNDQLWKDLGGKNSFSNLQNEFNKYINDQGFRLDRGNIGSNKIHTDKLEYQKQQLLDELANIKNEINISKKELDKIGKCIKKEIVGNDDISITLKKTLTGYSSKDVERLIEYANKLKDLNNINNYRLKEQDSKNISLKIENDFYKNDKHLIDLSSDNYNKHKYINDLESDISYKDSIIHKLTKTIDLIMKSPPLPSVNDYIKLSHKIQAKDDESWKEYHEMNKENNDKDKWKGIDRYGSL